MKYDGILRLGKISLVATMALYFTLVAFSNLTDYGTNFQFVQHVMSMDTTFEGNLMYRAITNPIAHHLFYWIIILWESVAAVLLWIGSITLFKHWKTKSFDKAKKIALTGLIAGLLLWFLAFITVGGEWFAMWQSSTWNGLDAALRMFTVNAFITVILMLKDN